MIIHVNPLLADKSHEISCLIFLKIKKDVAKLQSPAVVIGTLRFRGKKYSMLALQCTMKHIIKGMHCDIVVICVIFSCGNFIILIF